MRGNTTPNTNVFFLGYSQAELKKEIIIVKEIALKIAQFCIAVFTCTTRKVTFAIAVALPRPATIYFASTYTNTKYT